MLDNDTPLLNIDYSVLTPAYGRDYKSKKAMLEDFEAEKDFILEPSGQYINKQQIATGTKLEFRYKKLREVFIHTVTRKEEAKT